VQPHRLGYVDMMRLWSACFRRGRFARQACLPATTVRGLRQRPRSDPRSTQSRSPGPTPFPVAVRRWPVGKGASFAGIVALALGLGAYGAGSVSGHVATGSGRASDVGGQPITGTSNTGVPVGLMAASTDSSRIARGKHVVATVAGNPITLRAYEHWMLIAAVEQGSQQKSEPVIVPEAPPTFTSCIAQIRRDIPSLDRDSNATLRTDCAQDFKEFNNEVMTYLIEAYWYQADAYQQGINYTNADLQNDFKKELRSEFNSRGAFVKYLKTNGETRQDVLFQIRVSEIYKKLLKTEMSASSQSARERAVTRQVTREFRSSTMCGHYFMVKLCGGSRLAGPSVKAAPGVHLAPSAGPTTAPRGTTTTSTTPSVTTPKTGPLSIKPVFSVPSGPPPDKLVVTDLIMGTGATAKSGDELQVNYVGKLYSNGRIFDASWSATPGKAFGPFELDAGAVIKGWDRGLIGMKVGGRRELIIPPSLAYGAAGDPPTIPKNATLVFVVDLLSVRK
jgi:peptidylprolyl isomerase